MSKQSRLVSFWTVNLIGGIAVLGSYAAGILNHADDAGALWGSIDGPMRALYVGNMLPATLGYLAMFAFVLRHIAHVERFGLLLAVYAIFLGASTCWMPLTFRALETQDPAFLGAIQLVLAIAGLTSCWMWARIARIAPATPTKTKPAALALGAFLVLQCAVLDALIWPRYFHVG